MSVYAKRFSHFVLIYGLTFVAFAVFAGSGHHISARVASDSPNSFKNGKFKNTEYGFSVTIPSDYCIDGPVKWSSFTTNCGMNSTADQLSEVEFTDHDWTKSVTGDCIYKSVKDFIKSLAEGSCVSDGADGGTNCENRSVMMAKTIGGLNGFEVTTTLNGHGDAEDKTGKAGPHLFVFDIIYEGRYKLLIFKFTGNETRADSIMNSLRFNKRFQQWGSINCAGATTQSRPVSQ